MRTLTDKVAVITGAGSGIGRALALELARRGCRLALNDRTAEPLTSVRDEIRALGREVTLHPFDVGDRAAWPTFVEEVLAAHGAAHLVVNNAGVALTGPFTACSLDDLDWQLQVNLWGVVHGCHFWLPVLLRQPEAHLVNLSSIFGIITVPDSAAYCMSKHAVRSLTEALEFELGGTSVRVTSVHPGAVATRIAIDGRFHEGPRIDRERSLRLISGGLSPEQAARIVADGIQADRRRILVGRDANVLATVFRFAPGLFRWWVGRLIARAGRVQGRG